jgi:hypothetical protein
MNITRIVSYAMPGYPLSQWTSTKHRGCGGLPEIKPIIKLAAQNVLLIRLDAYGDD